MLFENRIEALGRQRSNQLLGPPRDRRAPAQMFSSGSVCRWPADVFVRALLGGGQRRCFPSRSAWGGQRRCLRRRSAAVPSADVFLHALLPRPEQMFAGGSPLWPTQTFSSTLG